MILCPGAPGPEVIKLFFILNSTEHEISTAHKSLSDVVFIMLIMLKCQHCWHFNIYELDKFCAQLS